MTRNARPALVAIVLALCAALPARAQLSPGPLTKAHQRFDTPLQCLACHGTRSSAVADQCSGCHKEIGWLIANRRGLHRSGAAGLCVTCHREHAGRDAALAPLPDVGSGNFRHDRTGWALAGKHATAKCRACHIPRFQVSEAATLMERTDAGKSYLGLEARCSACHEDPHGARLGADCQSCHDPAAWRPALKFAHARTAFPLAGKHTGVACEKCHRPSGVLDAASAGAKPVRIFGPLAHADCADCHRDRHEGRLGAPCARCHVVEGFAVRPENTGFDHARTRFALQGKHGGVACERCHGAPRDGEAAGTLRPRHAQCSDCHAAAHGKQLDGRADHGDCGACHVPSGWKPSTFTVAEHSKLPFALGGRHAVLACGRCHAAGASRLAPAAMEAAWGKARVPLSALDPACTACHVDPHRGRFSAGGPRARAAGCSECHGSDAFRPATIRLEAHRALGVVVEGAHAKVRCEGCHAELKRPLLVSSLRAEVADAPPLLFTVAGEGCAACHASPHGAQFEIGGRAPACGECHGPDGFKPAVRFDHDRKTRFPLLRSHSKVACTRCHERRTDAQGRTAVLYRPLSLNCTNCHKKKA